ncbi:crotonase/enoyl-CoA hydratase family protein [Moritella sp. 24]|uniref:crotonase/enoyl-CoA hydratase family protein n=1 Tax=Moritella sp. 24 TaxID=2746230 RepID=UPI001BA4A86B|nr:crotonase/enoyl-CoA hydratase family protein [Moritella sp. 24]QUM75654.1 crotonase/enoyl-CoA hydratase family protein [Moritella sp. 24]
MAVESTYTTFSLTIDNSVAHLQFNRPSKLNSMNLDFWREFPAAIAALSMSDDLRVLVISAQGPHFCAGMDLDVFQSPGNFPAGKDKARASEAMRRFVMQLQQVFTELEQLRIPVLTAIQGGCIGGALDLIAASDMRYCTQDAFFTIKEVELGITADLGSLQRLPSILPQGIVRELAYTGRNFSAAEADKFGLVNQVFETQEAMLDGVLQIASQIAAHSPLAVTGSKEMLNYSRDHGVDDSLKYMATWQAGMLCLDETVTILQAKAQRKAPVLAPLRKVTGLFES